MFNTIDDNGNIIGYVDRTTGMDIVDTDDFFNHENFDHLVDDYQDNFYTFYDEFMVYIISDILLPFMLPTYQQTRNPTINRQIEAYLMADDTDLRLQGLYAPVFSNVDDLQ